MAKKKTHDEYVQDVTKINPNIEVIGEYVNTRTPILHKCRFDGYEWLARPNNIITGTGCPLCGKKLKTTETFIKELSEVNDTIDVLGEYVDGHTTILCRCKIDGYEWNPLALNLLKGVGCPMCAGVKPKTHMEYVDEVMLINKNIEVIGTYVNARQPIFHKCIIDNTEWLASPHHILSGRGCPTCNASHGEKAIQAYLEKHQIKFQTQFTFNECRNIFCLPFDFYLSEYNTCIEYDGEQHYKSIEFFGGDKGFVQRKHNDNLKTEFCKNNNINLLRIGYNEHIESILDNFFSIQTIQN